MSKFEITKHDGEKLIVDDENSKAGSEKSQ
jgi:hypothetical protein